MERKARPASACACHHFVVTFRPPVCYYNNGIRRLAKSKKNARMGKPPAFFYTLTFTLEFQHDNDTVCVVSSLHGWFCCCSHPCCSYLAHCYPYPYTTLCRHLHSLETDPIRRQSVALPPPRCYCFYASLSFNIDSQTNFSITSPLSTPSVTSAVAKCAKQRRETPATL